MENGPQSSLTNFGSIAGKTSPDDNNHTSLPENLCEGVSALWGKRSPLPNILSFRTSLTNGNRMYFYMCLNYEDTALCVDVKKLLWHHQILHIQKFMGSISYAPRIRSRKHFLTSVVPFRICTPEKKHLETGLALVRVCTQKKNQGAFQDQFSSFQGVHLEEPVGTFQARRTSWNISKPV